MNTFRIFCLGTILLASYSSSQAQALSFSLPFEMHFEDVSMTLVIGMDPDGATAYVDGLDALAPPPPPDTHAFDARIRVNNVDYFTKYMPNTLETKEFTFIYAPSQGVSITWDHESLSDYGTFTVTDLDDSVSVDLEEFGGELVPSELGSLVQSTRTFIIRVEPKPATGPVQRTVNLTGIEGYRMLSSPAATDYETLLAPLWTQGPTGSDKPGEEANIWTWNWSGEGQGCWSPLARMQDSLVPGSGFLIDVFEDDDPDSPVGFPKTLMVDGPENEDGVVADVNSQAGGWTLLGNPFDAPIRFNDLTRRNLTDVIYVWDVNNDEDGSNSGDNGDTDPGAGSWKTYSLSAGAGDISDGIIAGFQGFFVQNADDGEFGVTFPASAKTTGGSFYGKQVSADVIRLELSGQGMRNATWLSFPETGSFEELAGDAHKLIPLSQHYALLSGIKNDNPYDISILPVPGEDFTFPISAEATIGGRYTLSVTDWNVSFNETLYLEDRVTQNVVMLGSDTDYKFELDVIPNNIVTDPPACVNGAPGKWPADDQPRFAVTTSATVHSEVSADLPAELTLSQNSPNPFNPSTVITYTLPEQMHARITVYDITGRRIATLVSKQQSPGSYDVALDASGLSSGVYICRLEAAGMSLTRLMTLIK